MKANRSKATEAKPADKPERAKRILDAASRLIVHYGFDKTTMDDIAREAGVSKGALYLHWSSKDDLFTALIWRTSWAYINEWLEAVLAHPEGGRLGTMLKLASLLLRKNPLMSALYARDLRVVGDYLRRSDPQLQQNRFIVGQEFMRQMQLAGLVRADLDMKVLSYITASLGHGLSKIDEVIPKENAPPMEDAIDLAYEMLDQFIEPLSGGDSETGKRLISTIIGRYKESIGPDGPKKGVLAHEHTDESKPRHSDEWPDQNL